MGSNLNGTNATKWNKECGMFIVSTNDLNFLDWCSAKDLIYKNDGKMCLTDMCVSHIETESMSMHD
jgi:hypothetical protein